MTLRRAAAFLLLLLLPSLAGAQQPGNFGEVLEVRVTSVDVVVTDRAGHPSHALTFTAEQASQMKGRRIGFAIQVPIEKGRHQISVGVVDHVSQGQGFATLKAAL